MPECAWSSKYGVTGLNAYWPDSAATYWSTVYPVTPGLKIRLSGVFPDARYSSFSVYDEKPAPFVSGGVSSNVPDYRITPDVGNANPWQVVGQPGGRFTITISPELTTDADELNKLPQSREDALPGAKASVIFRVYLPTGGDSTVVLPTVTLIQNGVSKTLSTCSSGLAANTPEPLADRPDRPDQPDRPDRPDHPDRPGRPGPADVGAKLFMRTSEVDNLAPNPDNAYLGAWLTPPGADRVIVIRGRGPRAASGTHPSVWPAKRTDVRYWSLCTNLGGQAKPVVINRFPEGPPSYGCRYDDEAQLDWRGNYAYVIGTEAQRSTIESVGTATFLPFSTTYPTAPHLVLLRNLLPTEGFAEAVQNVPKDSPAETAAEIMGPYYPIVTVCPLAALVAEGPRHCAS